MKEFKGTKGEWNYPDSTYHHDPDNGEYTIYVRTDADEWEDDSNSYTIAGVNGRNLTKCLKNAQLIAAAPELLEALQGLLKSSFPRHTGEFCEKDSKHPAYIAFKAINKALGE